MFNIITGYYSADTAKYDLEGKEINGLPTHDLRAPGSGGPSQNIELFHDLTVRDNMRASRCSATRR